MYSVREGNIVIDVPYKLFNLFLKYFVTYIFDAGFNKNIVETRKGKD